ncbi:unnamed protein product [Schistosoma margrebowiei]|uniref:Uncharacterized protein n=1 Tax=Schistosoma margrebowiei TaxID=48269 RepID=A0A183MCI3_9TREM|nr:unnamed protein product [Schistosoma margrebowiei]
MAIRQIKSGKAAGTDNIPAEAMKGDVAEKRKTKEQITLRNGDGHEKNEQELDGTRKEGPGQSGLENAGRRPMLHWE